MKVPQTKCFLCEKDLTDSDRKYMYPIMASNVNLYIHFDCWLDIKDNFTSNAILNKARVFLENK